MDATLGADIPSGSSTASANRDDCYFVTAEDRGQLGYYSSETFIQSVGGPQMKTSKDTNEGEMDWMDKTQAVS